MKYKIGEILISKEDTELQTVLGDTVIIPKGNKIIIGADEFAHHLRNGFIQPLNEEDTVKGYDSEGLAEYIFTIMKRHFPIEEMIDDYDLTETEVQNEIQYALEEIGL